MKELFGTDGIRGKVNLEPMTIETALKVGRTVAFYFGAGQQAKIVIGRDTRISGTMLEAAITAGATSMGADVLLTGVLPVSGVARMTVTKGAQAGIMLSASHNPYDDNGIKIFQKHGGKLSDEVEIALEKLILEKFPVVGNLSPGQVLTKPDDQNYLAFLKESLPPGFSLKGLKIILDCAHGATYRIAPQIFKDLGAVIETMGISPDGTNINADCGSEFPQKLMQQVKTSKADLGFAFDGDGDRLIAVDGNGRRISGDHILAICAQDLQKQGKLKNNLIVCTVMSNLGLHKALRALKIETVIVPVGDRYVLEAMQSKGAVLGGEDSGHIIFSSLHTTGDGILTALCLLKAMHNSDQSLAQLADIMAVYPQVLVNVPVKQKINLDKNSAVQKVIKIVETKLGHDGRVLVRYSGTQLLCRIMVEAPQYSQAKEYCNQIATVLTKEV